MIRAVANTEMQAQNKCLDGYYMIFFQRDPLRIKLENNKVLISQTILYWKILGMDISYILYKVMVANFFVVKMIKYNTEKRKAL